MEYLKVNEIAKKWNISERSVRYYCSQNRVDGAILIGKTWNIPKDAKKPVRANKKEINYLLETLIREREVDYDNGILYELRIQLTYNSNYIEGNTLSLEQVRSMYKTQSISVTKEIDEIICGRMDIKDVFKVGVIKVDDVFEAANHFECVNIVIDNVNNILSESFIKNLHKVLLTGTFASRKSWFAVGDYKKVSNVVDEQETTKPEDVKEEMQKLLAKYNEEKTKTFEELLDFHHSFERIHPFQDGNGRIGRLILLKECLRNNIVPFIITTDLKQFYYRGLREWKKERGYLRDACLAAQDKFKDILNYFQIPFND